MNHLFALIAMLAFRRRRKSAAGDCLPNAWKSSALVLGLFAFIGTPPNTAHADGALLSGEFESHACQAIMGLNSSEAQYAACVGSLSDSLAAAYHKNDVSRGANNVSWNPFQRACAEVGIRPYSRIFKKCVVDLSSTLFKLDSIPGR